MGWRHTQGRQASLLKKKPIYPFTEYNPRAENSFNILYLMAQRETETFLQPFGLDGKTDSIRALGRNAGNVKKFDSFLECFGRLG